MENIPGAIEYIGQQDIGGGVAACIIGVALLIAVAWSAVTGTLNDNAQRRNYKRN